jgi:hypothetical protein
MIHALRVQHLRTFVGLAVLLPAGLWAGLHARPALPRVDALPSDLASAQGFDGHAVETLATRTADFGALRVTMARVRAADGSDALELRPAAAVDVPDVLAYWSADTTGATRLPVGAILLGALGGAHARRFALPAAAASAPGRLYLYSLAHGELVGSAALVDASP